MDEMTEVITQDTIPYEETEVELQSLSDEEPEGIPEPEEQPPLEDLPDAPPPAADTVTLKYNHSDVVVSAEEAKRLAQYGMHLEKLGSVSGEDVRQIMTDLDYFATLHGKSIKDIVKQLVDGVENAYREELTDNLGEGNPLIEEMLQLRRDKNRKAYEEAKTERQSSRQQAIEDERRLATARLAEQFEAVSREFPEYRTVSDIPEMVLKKGMQGGDLEKEILRYKLSEEQKINAAITRRQKNNSENIGSVHSADTEPTAVSAFKAGVWA